MDPASLVDCGLQRPIETGYPGSIEQPKLIVQQAGALIAPARLPTEFHEPVRSLKRLAADGFATFHVA